MKISILDLQKKYGIQRDTFYGRTRYLRITTWKEGGKAYLDAGQVQQMVHDHIKTTGRMEGYLVPEPSGPVEEELQADGFMVAFIEPATPKQMLLEIAH
ncbi:MAG: hypothetical protein ACYTXY_47180, partial [Nostoc sp.]